MRQAWVEGEDGLIYDPLVHYRDFQSFAEFVREIKSRTPQDYCFFTAYKPTRTSSNLYEECPDIALFFSEPVKQIGEKTIYRHRPVYGPLPWRHLESRYHLSAFFNVADNTPGLIVKGHSASQSNIEKLGSGKLIPSSVSPMGIWHPEDFGYPLGSTIGKLTPEDWRNTSQYFAEKIDLSISKPRAGSPGFRAIVEEG